jgi:anaerobic ribonucleoside-triphosphate reductase activating protein
VLFDDAAKQEIYDQLNKDYISGITFSGGDPLHSANRHTIRGLVEEIRRRQFGSIQGIFGRTSCIIQS